VIKIKHHRYSKYRHGYEIINNISMMDIEWNDYNILQDNNQEFYILPIYHCSFGYKSKTEFIVYQQNGIMNFGVINKR
jgi:hypothetical protein